MQRVGEFEKVSFEQFCEAVKSIAGKESWDAYVDKDSDAQITETLYQCWQGISLPRRATSGSAGYDFKAPFPIRLAPGDTITIPTGIRVQIDEGWWLGCLPRSGLGFKYRLQLNNTMAVIDSDYYHSDNEGHIFVKITNNSNEGKTISVKQGEAFVQAIFIPYGITYSDDADGVRNGGMGSTSK